LLKKNENNNMADNLITQVKKEDQSKLESLMKKNVLYFLFDIFYRQAEKQKFFLVHILLFSCERDKQ